MVVIITLSLIFILSFIFLFWFIYKSEKAEGNKDFNLFLVFITAVLLAIVVTISFGLILLVIIGAINVVEYAFSIPIETNKVLLLSVILFIYLFTVDGFFEGLCKELLEKNMRYILLMVLIRFTFIYAFTYLVGINQRHSLFISFGLAIIIMIFEVLYQFRKENKST